MSENARRDGAGLDRRHFLVAGSSALGLAACQSAPNPADARVEPATHRPRTGYLFALGVASGEPMPDSVVLWTRLAPDPLNGGGMPPTPLRVQWEIAEDEGLRRVVRRGEAMARPESAHAL